MVPKYKYLGGLVPGHVFKLCDSHTWAGLKEEWTMIKKGFCWAIGNGEKTKT